MKRGRWKIYSISLALVLVAIAVASMCASPKYPVIPMSAEFPPGDEIHLDGGIVIIDDAPGDGALLKDLADYLRKRFDLPVRIEERTLVSDVAYDADRGQWNVAWLLRQWSAIVAGGRGRLLVVTDKDTFIEHLNWTTGCAQCGGPAAVISLHRLRPEFWGNRPDPERLRQRAIRIAMHELGHTWGKRGHCRNQCVIGGTNSIIDIDNLPVDYCGDCLTLARDAVASIREGEPSRTGR